MVGELFPFGDADCFIHHRAHGRKPEPSAGLVDGGRGGFLGHPALPAEGGGDLRGGAHVPATSDEPMDVSMRILLGRLRERHGDALAPLRAAGLGDETIARLQARALTA